MRFLLCLLLCLPFIAGAQYKSDEHTFRVVKLVEGLDHPWSLAFLPDGRMLVTEKVGPIWLVTQQGLKRQVLNYPAALYGGQGGMFGIYVSPTYATDQTVYLTYAEPGTLGGISGSSLALAKARLVLNDSATPATASLDNVQVIWRDGARGRGGQFGANIAFAPDGKSLFLTVGERQALAAGGGDDPGRQAARLADRIELFQQRHAHRLKHVRGVSFAEAVFERD